MQLDESQPKDSGKKVAAVSVLMNAMARHLLTLTV